MNTKENPLIYAMTGIPACIILSVITAGVIVCGQVYFTDLVSGLMILRVTVSVIAFLIAMAVAASRRHSLFINCIFFGTMCFFLSQVWIFANYVWIEQETSDSIIEIISNVGFYMFLFSASYGALDSLADDRTRKYHRYRITAGVVSALAAALFVFRLIRSFSVYVLVYGIILCPVVYISVKHLLIPDIENGYVRTLRSYYIVVLIMVIIKVAETLIYGVDGLSGLLMSLKLGELIALIWLFPMSIKGVRKWTSL